MSHIENNPFIHGELDRLMEAKLDGDMDFLKDWSTRAIKAYEATRNREVKFQEKAIKWDKFIAALSKGIIDRDDLVNLEYGEGEKK